MTGLINILISPFPHFSISSFPISHFLISHPPTTARMRNKCQGQWRRFQNLPLDGVILLLQSKENCICGEDALWTTRSGILSPSIVSTHYWSLGLTAPPAVLNFSPMGCITESAHLEEISIAATFICVVGTVELMCAGIVPSTNLT